MSKFILKLIVAVSVAFAFIGTAAFTQTMAIKGGTVHTLGKNGTMVNATILIVDGKITAVGQNVTIPKGADVIDATDKIVVPGFMHSGSSLGLSEISATQDSNEHSAKKSPFSAAFDVRYGLRSNSIVIPDNRRHGLTHAITQPSGSDGMFYGSGAVISLSSGTEMVFSKGPMVANPSQAGNRNIAWAKIRLIFDQVKYYEKNRGRFTRGDGPDDFQLSSLNMAALIPVIHGRQKLVLMVNSEDDIRQAIALKRDYGVDLILSGAVEAWKVATELVAADIPVIIDPQNNLPAGFSRVAATYRNAAHLAKAGVQFAISPGGMASNHNAHYVNQMAGMAVAHGLDWDRALEAITLSPAQIFGIDKSFGSLERGKVANIVLWDGDPLNVTSNPTHVIVKGVNHPLVSRRTMLRDRYLGLKKKPFAYN